MEPRKSPYFKSGIRHNLFMGCDRMMIVFVLAISGILMWVYTFAWWADIVAALWFMMGRFWLRKAAKADPLLFKVYIKALMYCRLYAKGGYYPARSTYFAKPLSTPSRWR
jgi:type IV secretion system protein TrbD